MIEYQDEQGDIVLAKKTVYAVFLREKGWVLPFISDHGVPGYVVQFPGTEANNRTYPNAIHWYSEEDFTAKYEELEDA